MPKCFIACIYLTCWLQEPPSRLKPKSLAWGEADSVVGVCLVRNLRQRLSWHRCLDRIHSIGRTIRGVLGGLWDYFKQRFCFKFKFPARQLQPVSPCKELTAKRRKLLTFCLSHLHHCQLAAAVSARQEKSWRGYLGQPCLFPLRKAPTKGADQCLRGTVCWKAHQNPDMHGYLKGIRMVNNTPKKPFTHLWSGQTGW